MQGLKQIITNETQLVEQQNQQKQRYQQSERPNQQSLIQINDKDSTVIKRQYQTQKQQQQKVQLQKEKENIIIQENLQGQSDIVEQEQKVEDQYFDISTPIQDNKFDNNVIQSSHKEIQQKSQINQQKGNSPLSSTIVYQAVVPGQEQNQDNKNDNKITAKPRPQDRALQLVYRMNQLRKNRQLKYKQTKMVIQPTQTDYSQVVKRNAGRIVRNIISDSYQTQNRINNLRLNALKRQQISGRRYASLDLDSNIKNQHTAQYMGRTSNVGRIVKIKNTNRGGNQFDILPPIPASTRSISRDRESISNVSSSMKYTSKDRKIEQQRERKRQIYILQKSKKINQAYHLRKFIMEWLYLICDESVQRVQQKRTFLSYKRVHTKKHTLTPILLSKANFQLSTPPRSSAKTNEQFLDKQMKLSSFIHPKHERELQHANNLHQGFNSSALSRINNSNAKLKTIQSVQQLKNNNEEKSTENMKTKDKKQSKQIDDNGENESDHSSNKSQKQQQQQQEYAAQSSDNDSSNSKEQNKKQQDSDSQSISSQSIKQNESKTDQDDSKDESSKLDESGRSNK